MIPNRATVSVLSKSSPLVNIHQRLTRRPRLRPALNCRLTSAVKSCRTIQRIVSEVPHAKRRTHDERSRHFGYNFLN